VLGSKLTVFSGASSGNDQSYEATDGASLVLRDLWYEGEAPRGFANIHGRASFTMQASRVASHSLMNVPSFAITNLDGRVSILTTHIDDRITISGNGALANVLGLGTFREYQESSYFENTTAPAATVSDGVHTPAHESAGTLQSRHDGRTRHRDGRPRICPPNASGRTSRRPASPLVALPASVSDVRMFRVWAGGGLNNIIIRP